MIVEVIRMIGLLLLNIAHEVLFYTEILLLQIQGCAEGIAVFGLACVGEVLVKNI
jgi:hypothetical protein